MAFPPLEGVSALNTLPAAYFNIILHRIREYLPLFPKVYDIQINVL